MRIRGQHSGDCALARLWSAAIWTAAARRKRRSDRRGGSALPGRVPGRIEPRQRHCDLPVDADAGHCGRRADGHVLQLSRGCRGEAGRCGGALPLQGSSMAKHLLGVAAARCCVRTGQLVCYGVAALAFSAGTKGSRERCSAQVAQPRAGRAGTCRDGGDDACAEERGRRFASRCCGGSTRFHFCWPA